LKPDGINTLICFDVVQPIAFKPTPNALPLQPSALMRTPLEFDPTSRSVRARKVCAINKVVLAKAPTKVLDFDAAAIALYEGIENLS